MNEVKLEPKENQEENQEQHIDIEFLDALANNQNIDSKTLELILGHLSRCLICSSQLEDLENARKG